MSVELNPLYDSSAGGAGAGSDASSGSADPGAPAEKSTLIGAVHKAVAPVMADNQQASLQVDERSNLKTTMATLIAGENQDRDYLNTVSGATEVLFVPEGSVDFLLGTVGSGGDYLDHIDIYVTDPTKSQIVIRDGQTAPVLTLTSHTATASTATVVNTAANAAAVTQNQYRGYLMKLGTEYKRILAHPAFAAGAVNQYTLAEPLSAAPALGASFSIEDRRYVWEIRPNNTSRSGDQHRCRFRSYQQGFRITAGAGVYLRAVGDFT